MPKFSAIATAFALLVHSLLGCCCHHVHARPAESNHAAQGCPCQQHRSEPQQDDHLPAEPCEEGHCTLVASDAVATSVNDGPGDLGFCTRALLPSQAPRGACYALRVAHSPRPSPTLFELHQILRI